MTAHPRNAQSNPVAFRDGASCANSPAKDAEPAGRGRLAGSSNLSSRETASPDAHRASGDACEITVRLSPAVALILRLLRIATDLDDDEIIARGIGTYAKVIGIPALARDMTVDLTDVPEFVRPNIDRYRNGGP